MSKKNITTVDGVPLKVPGTDEFCESVLFDIKGSRFSSALGGRFADAGAIPELDLLRKRNRGQ